MRTGRSVLVLLVAAVFVLSLVFPTEDLPETTYDESETLPYKSAPLVASAPAPDRLSGATTKSDCFWALSVATGLKTAPRRQVRSCHAISSLAILDHEFRC